MRLTGSTAPLSLALALVSFLGSGTLAYGWQDRTEVGRHITIAPGEQASEVTCFGCSVRIRGHVKSDVTVFGGSVIVEDRAEVDGDITAFAGRVRLDDRVKVDGDVAVFGGRIHRDPGAFIGGDLTDVGNPGLIVLLALIPLIGSAALIALIVWLVCRLMSPPVPATA
jgi:hypothetical protein